MGRLIVVSNRLPVNLTEKTSGNGYDHKISVGGVSIGLGSWLTKSKIDYVWVGWPGKEIPEVFQPEVSTALLREQSCIPVFLNEKELEGYYHGFCNSTIWPVFHYMPDRADFSERNWETYKSVNQKFADIVAKIYQPGDTIFVQDYQLMLLPALLRKLIPGAAIGFFLHIPFPSFEMYRNLPSAQRVIILGGLLSADVIGFHTQEYTRYFLSSVQRVLGLDHNLGRVNNAGREVIVATFPLGIDYEYFVKLQSDKNVLSRISKLKEEISDKRVVISVDRLDYSKGIPHRLRGFSRFLRDHPEFQGNVCLLVVAVPSRVEVREYQRLKQQVDELVGEINGEFGRVDWTPVLYQYRGLDHLDLAALYSIGDVAMVTPLRDGMNLIAKEYLASRIDNTGVLILSEFAGAARELTQSLLINPNSEIEIANALYKALVMSKQEQLARNTLMRSLLSKHTVFEWGLNIITSMSRSTSAKNSTVYITDQLSSHIKEEFVKADSRLVVLDYDGTLMEFASDPMSVSPTKEIKSLITELVHLPDTTVVICSGRMRDNLEDWFSGIPVWIVAEHGAEVRLGTNADWQRPAMNIDAWRVQIRSMLEDAVHAIPGSFVEEKNYSLAWHYRKAIDLELAKSRSRELIDEIRNHVLNLEVKVLDGNMVVEVKNANISKGSAISRILAEVRPAAKLIIGDDVTDEDMFSVATSEAITIKVGDKPTCARYRLPDPASVRSFLRSLVD